MKAMVYTRLGPPEVLQLREIAQPVPADNQVLVRVVAASVNAHDCMRFTSQLEGNKIPLSVRTMDGLFLKALNSVLGSDLAGQVVAVGSKVTRFKPGDEVFGLSAGLKGAFAEYACADENQLALKPPNLSFEAAAAAPVAGVSALVALRDKGRIRPGQKVLINGASGGVGTFAIQLARSFEAEVTAVCSPGKMEMARSLGASQVIDYTWEDFTKNGILYDLIVAVGGYRSILAYRRALRPDGNFVHVGGSIALLVQAITLGPLLSGSGKKKLGFLGIANISYPDLEFIGELLQSGKITPVIDRRYSLDEVPQAIRYVAGRHAAGKVIIRVSDSPA